MTQAHTLPTTARDGDLRAATPSANWRVSGESDPHGTRYDCERAQLMMGDLTDDELANAVYLHGDARPSVQDVLAGKSQMPTVYLAAAKDRIRWLSRQLDAALTPPPAQDPVPALGLPAGEVEGLRAAISQEAKECREEAIGSAAEMDFSRANHFNAKAEALEEALAGFPNSSSAIVLAPPASAADGEGLRDERPLAEQAKHHGRDWAVWWQGSGERGDHIMEVAQSGLGYARELTFLGADHHDQAGVLVAEHNEQVRRLREVIARQAAAKALLQKEVADLRSEAEFNRHNAGPSPWPEPWKRCPSTHCERSEECRSPHDCIVRRAPPAVPPTRVAGLDLEALARAIYIVNSMEEEEDRAGAEDDWDRGFSKDDREKAFAAAAAVHALAHQTPALAPTPGETPRQDAVEALHIVFDGPPGPDAGRFVEVETPDGKSVSVGSWHDRPDGFVELRLPALASLRSTQADTGGERQTPAAAGDAVEAAIAALKAQLSREAKQFTEEAENAREQGDYQQEHNLTGYVEGLERAEMALDDLRLAALAAIAQGPGAGQTVERVPVAWAFNRPDQAYLSITTNPERDNLNRSKLIPLYADVPLPAAPATAASEGDGA